MASEIVNFYSGKNILITGATGYVGKVLLEKILRCFDDVGRIYITIRNKKGRDKENRLNYLLQSDAFSRVKNRKNQLEKIIAISADLNEENIGLSEADVQLLTSEIDVVFHCAATVNFMENLQTAVKLNIIATKTVLDLAKEMKNLKAFIYVSTAYSFSNRREIGEIVYQPKFTAEEIIDLVKIMDDETVGKTTTTLIENWPNTYTFTKAVAEDLVIQQTDLPVAIVRPSMVTPAVKEPHPGWADSLLGPMGIMIACHIGLVRTSILDENIVADWIPLDAVTNLLVTVPYEVANDGNKIAKVYNCVSSAESPVTWGNLMKRCYEIHAEVPSIRLIWFAVYYTTTKWWTTKLQRLLLHMLPAYIMDFFIMFTDSKIRMKDMYKKLHKHIDAAVPFSTIEYKFSNDNIRDLWNKLGDVDKELFWFSLKNFKWNEYIEQSTRMGRKYLLREGPETLPAAKRRHKKFKVAHYTLITVLLLLLIYLGYVLLLLIMQLL